MPTPVLTIKEYVSQFHKENYVYIYYIDSM